jgi:hypothetical protein
VGSLAATLERWSDSDAHFQHALETHERMGAESLAARTRIEWGLAMAAGGRRLQARNLLGSGAAGARQFELAGLEQLARNAMGQIESSTLAR